MEKPKKIVLLGGGGHCKSVIDTLLRIGTYSEIVITDPRLAMSSKVMGCNVVGGDEMLPDLFAQGFTDAFITAGNVGLPSPRHDLATKAREFGYRFPKIIDPLSYVSASAEIGEGTFVGKGAIINAEAKVGNHCILNTGCVIEHEAIIGEFCHVATGAKVCGQVCIGDRSFIGAGSVIIQCINVGNDVVIGAASLVNSDVGKGCKAYGVPVRVVETGIE